MHLGFARCSAILCLLIYQRVIIAKFADSTTPLLVLLLLRGVGHSAVSALLISLCGWAHHHIVEDLGGEPHRASIIYGQIGVLLPLMGRFLQSSAESVGQSLMFELFATGAEILMMDTLLRGLTPLQSKRRTIACICMTDCNKGKRPGKDGKELTKRDENRIAFCSDAIIISSLGEASALIVSTAETILSRVSLGAIPGSPRKALGLIWANFIIMLFGELVVTDSLIGWMARRFTSRYVIDPTIEWQRMKKRGTGFLKIAVFVVAIYFPAWCALTIWINGCVTAHVGNEEEWAVTSCPAAPSNITEMSRVGDSFY